MQDGVFYAELNELLQRELAEDGYAGVEVRVTPMRTEIIIRATRTQNVLGKYYGPYHRLSKSQCMGTSHQGLMAMAVTAICSQGRRRKQHQLCLKQAVSAQSKQLSGHNAACKSRDGRMYFLRESPYHSLAHGTRLLLLARASTELLSEDTHLRSAVCLQQPYQHQWKGTLAVSIQRPRLVKDWMQTQSVGRAPAQFAAAGNSGNKGTVIASTYAHVPLGPAIYVSWDAFACACAGEKGRRIRELTSVVQKRFNFPPESVELYAEKVADRGLCAIAQAESLRYKLLGGLAVRRFVHACMKSALHCPACKKA